MLNGINLRGDRYENSIRLTSKNSINKLTPTLSYLSYTQSKVVLYFSVRFGYAQRTAQRTEKPIFWKYFSKTTFFQV
jgi:hypothetical protein